MSLVYLFIPLSRLYLTFCMSQTLGLSLRSVIPPISHLLYVTDPWSISSFRYLACISTSVRYRPLVYLFIPLSRLYFITCMSKTLGLSLRSVIPPVSHILYFTRPWSISSFRHPACISLRLHLRLRHRSGMIYLLSPSSCLYLTISMPRALGLSLQFVITRSCLSPPLHYRPFGRCYSSKYRSGSMCVQQVSSLLFCVFSG